MGGGCQLIEQGELLVHFPLTDSHPLLVGEEA